MRVLGIIIGVVLLFFSGFTLGMKLWSDEAIPLWLLPLFPIPATLFLDYCVNDSRRGVLKYSTTLWGFCLTPLSYCIIEFKVFRILFVGVGLLAFYLYCEGRFLALIVDGLQKIALKVSERER